MRFILLCSIPLVVLAGSEALFAQGLPTLKIGVESADSPKEVALALRILLLLTVLTLAPAILITMTSFMRIVIVLGLLRQALGAQMIPPNQVLIGLSLFMTYFIMQPVIQEIQTRSVTPYMDGKLDQGGALAEAFKPLREFMLKQTRKNDIALFLKLSKSEKPESVDAVGAHILIPAFIISEMKTAFQIGFMVFIPFIVIDIVISSVLLGMGMMMLPPVVISLPFKLMLFVLVDGWNLVVGSLVKSFI